MNKIVSKEGYVLTNGQAYGKDVWLGKNDSADNWHEISEEEYQKILEEQNEILQIERVDK